MRPSPAIGPQPGKQAEFMACQADVALFGGAAGGGKSHCLLLEAMRYRDVPGFNALIFRRTTPQILSSGALYQESENIYPRVGGRGSKHHLLWRFPKGATVKFSHMENEDDRFAWQGAQLSFIGFDELTHFTEAQFWYMLSRLRSMCGVRPYCRATTNPLPGWVAKLVEWWIDQDSGLAIPERSGKVRWFARDGDEIHWADTKQELKDRLGADAEPKSFSFISASVKDNPILMDKNPDYVASLKAMPKIERMRLLDGNWKVTASAGLFFKARWIEIVSAAPAEGTCCRYWDRAGTEGRGDYTVGLKMRKHGPGVFFVEDVVRLRGSPLAVEQAIVNTASRDGISTTICLEQDPGQAGKADVGNLIRRLAGYNVRAIPVTQDKETRAKPVSAQAEAGNVKLVKAPWNDALLSELENFPEGEHDDQVDTLSGAFNHLLQIRRVFFAV